MTVDARIGTTLQGKYAIERVLGEGGMGIVYAARHLRLDRPVAIKFLHAAYARDRGALGRFEGEARAAGSLRHPNVVDVVDVDVDEEHGAPFMVLELLQGESLASLLRRRGALPASEAIALIDPVLDALEAAHARGIVHRDLKPDNLFLASEAGRVVPKLLDFGIAKLRDGASGVATATGTAIGTPMYMAPEQARGVVKDVGPRIDVWAMGVVLFECVTGRMPFDFAPDAGALAWLGLVATGRPHRVRDVAPAVPEAIAGAIDAALEVDPGRRTPSVAALRAALRGEPPPLEVAPLEAAASASSRPSTPIPETRALSSGGGGRPPMFAWAIAIMLGVALVAIAALAIAASSGEPVASDEAPSGEVAPVAGAPSASGGGPQGSASAEGETPQASATADGETPQRVHGLAQEVAPTVAAAETVETPPAQVEVPETTRATAAPAAPRRRAGDAPVARQDESGERTREGTERGARTRSGEWRVEDL